VQRWACNASIDLALQQPDRYTGHEKSLGQHILFFILFQLSSALSQEIIKIANDIKTNRPTRGQDRTDRQTAGTWHTLYTGSSSMVTQDTIHHNTHEPLYSHTALSCCGADASTTARPLERFSGINQTW